MKINYKIKVDVVKSIRSEIRLTNNYLKPLCPLPSVQPFTPGLHTKAVTFTILPVTLVKTATEIKKDFVEKNHISFSCCFQREAKLFYINFNVVFCNFFLLFQIQTILFTIKLETIRCQVQYSIICE